jgi:RNA polymerase sigma-70 factor (ECF subfamily)
MRGTEQETAFVIQAQCGDRDAMEHVLRGVQPQLRRYIVRLIGPDAADDVLQDVLIAVARKLSWLEEPSLFRAGPTRVATARRFAHIAERRRGRQRRRRSAGGARRAGVQRPDEGLRELLDSPVLSPASRAVLILHFQEDMPLGEVAAVLEIPLGTVKSRLAYGLTALRRHLVDK